MTVDSVFPDEGAARSGRLAAGAGLAIGPKRRQVGDRRSVPNPGVRRFMLNRSDGFFGTRAHHALPVTREANLAPLEYDQFAGAERMPVGGTQRS